MSKKSRKDFVYLGEYEFVTGEDRWAIRVLADCNELIDLQGDKAKASHFKHNRQSYGPFKVTVTIKETLKKEKRTRKKKQ